MIKEAFDKLAQMKVYLSNSTFYIGLVNFAMIFATFKNAYNIPVSSLILVPAGFAVILIVGYLDYKLIMLPQMKHLNEKNNVLQEIRELRKELQEIKKELSLK